MDSPNAIDLQKYRVTTHHGGLRFVVTKVGTGLITAAVSEHWGAEHFANVSTKDSF